jgi:type I restriction enzyme S subunit
MREDVMRQGGTLPPGWVWTRLGEITDTTRMRADPQDHPDARFIGMEHVEAHTMRLLGTIPAREMHSSAERFKPGDVLYGRLRPYLNKVLSPDFAGLCSGEFIIFRKVPHLENRYLQYFLNSADFVSFASHLNAGDRPRVNFDQLADYPFPLPAIAEQRRIVAEIEKQFTRLDAGVVALKRVQANLKRYRASVLKAACEGRLAPQDPNDEPADRLLARILAERRAKWEAEHPGKKYVEPAAPVTDGLSELPVGWCWARAEQLCDFITKGTTPSADKLFSGSGDVPFIKVYNLTDRGNLDFNVNPTFVSRQTHIGELARSRVYPGDVLMNIVGPPLGKVSIVPDQHPEWNVNQAIAIFRPMPSYNRRFLCHCLLTEQMLAWAIRRAKATAGQFNLTLEICRDLPLPVPPLAEQHRIVAEVERRLSVVTALEATVAANLARAGRLRQAVLKRAFEGRLVAQDADDVQAEVLLAHIQTARTSVGA